MRFCDLPTPALIADRKIILENMQKMSEILEGKKLRLRPHYKSNKCSAIAHMQMERGAVGITCAKLSEAEDLVMSGIDDVLIANQIVGKDKLFRLALLAGKCRLTVCVDDESNARDLSEAAVITGNTVHCLVEYEIGMERCGIADPQDYLKLAKVISELPNLEYDGIQAYAGHVSHMLSREERLGYTEENFSKIRELKALLEKSGIEVRTISGGSTGTAEIKAEGDLYTELQAGSYFFLDSTYNKLDIPFRNSLYVLATVMSKKPGLTILDVGVKGLGTDQDDPLVFTLNGEEVKGNFELNEEHFKIFSPSADLAMGEKVMIIPGHCCSTVNLYDQLYLYEDDKVVDRLGITARGCSR